MTDAADSLAGQPDAATAIDRLRHIEAHYRDVQSNPALSESQQAVAAHLAGITAQLKASIQTQQAARDGGDRP